jgi:hypothetical protein
MFTTALKPSAPAPPTLAPTANSAHGPGLPSRSAADLGPRASKSGLPDFGFQKTDPRKRGSEARSDSSMGEAGLTARRPGFL